MKRCLIADPSEIIRKVARVYLEQLSFEVHEASSADEALAICRQHAFDALILDGRLPGKTTVEFLSALRFGDVSHKPLIIYLTMENDPPAISRAFAAGAHTYLLKPFDHLAFTQILANVGLAAA